MFGKQNQSRRERILPLISTKEIKTRVSVLFYLFSESVLLVCLKGSNLYKSKSDLVELIVNISVMDENYLYKTWLSRPEFKKVPVMNIPSLYHTQYTQSHIIHCSDLVMFSFVPL